MNIQFLNEEDINYSESNLIIKIENEIESKKELLLFLSTKFHFPAYFGNNWDALYDCLQDLSWIEQEEVLLYHRFLPKIGKEDLKIYLDILDETIENWSTRKNLEFKAVFFPVYKEEVFKLIT